MGNKSSGIKTILILTVIGVSLFCLIYGGIALTKNVGKPAKVITMENVNEEFETLYKDIEVNKVTARKASVNLDVTTIEGTLPDIAKYPAQVDKTTENFIEIFSSTEKTGIGKDGLLVDIANSFNKDGIIIDGKKVSVRIRGLASGTGMDYISSGKYMPDAFTPSNELWGDLMKSKGVALSLVEPRLVGNVAGVLLSKAKKDNMVKKFGSVNLKAITDATITGDLAMGYTNPLASSTGFNFLVSTLCTFDYKNPLSATAVSNFEKFQANVPYVAYTTLQMRDSAKSGMLDGFIMEYQTYFNTPELMSDYVFTPFGYRHDSPIYSIGNLSDIKKAILSKFIEYCKNDKNKKLATDYGFNQLDNYVAEVAPVTGDILGQSLKLWKDKKSGDKNIAAVFVADVSGSMAGKPLSRLKESLLKGSQFIGKGSSVGLVSYSDNVNINLPLGKFDLNQRSLFTGAVTDLQVQGGTATFDGIIVAVKMLLDEKAKDPNAKLMLFVLSDGETNAGHSLNDITGILKAYKIPVYTIGYNADIKALSAISSINEAASINADSDDVIYKLSNLFNAEM